MRILLLFLMIVAFYGTLEAQRIEGLVKADQGKPLSGASIILKRTKDSSVVKLSISSATGQYEFSSIAAGEYFISVTHLGYLPHDAGPFQVKEEDPFRMPDIQMGQTSRQLKEAVVAGRKPLIEVKTDKIILNVEGSINAIGESALELLRKAPGVTMDKDDNPSLNGKNGLQIFIDGRPTYLNGTNLTEYLKTIPSSSIESIEIITNPSAKYEAAGNAGIINIRLKKDKSLGTNATISGGYNIGTYGKENAALSFNHRTKDLNFFGDYTYNHSINEFYADMNRTVADSLFRQHIDMIQTTSAHTFKTGLDYFVNKRNTIGIVVSGVFANNTIQSNGTTPIIYQPDNTTSRVLEADSRTDGSRNNINADLNYRYSDSAGRELSMYADYNHYRLRSTQFQPNNYFDSTRKQLLYNDTYTLISPTDISIYSWKADYEQNLWKGRLGFGGKFSYVTSGNDFREYDLVGSGNILDTTLSNNFDYKENINALYLNYNLTVKGWVLQAGLRGENTNIKGTSIGYTSQGQSNGYDSAFTRNYTDLFPSASVTYDKNPMKQWTLSYSRRIDRPVYQDLNPFEFKLDEYTYSKGNTLLRPQYTNSVGLTFMYKYKLTATLNYSHIKDLSTTLVDTTDASRTVVYSKNLASQDLASLNISYPFQYKWYSLFININSCYQLNKANFGPGRKIDLNVFNASVFTQHSFAFGSGWTGQITQTYVSAGIWQATLRSHSLWTIDAGLQKSLLKGNAAIKASVTDVFNTLRYTATSDFAGQHIYSSSWYETRMLKLSFSYRLGNRQLKAASRQASGSEDENKRVGSANGTGGK